MKVTRKMKDDMPHVMMERGKNEEIAPSLRLSELPKEIEGLEPGKDFEAHIKGKCTGYECRDRGEGERHHYELDVHHFDHHGGKEMNKKKGTHEEVGEAMDKYDKEEEHKRKSKEEKKEEK